MHSPAWSRLHDGSVLALRSAWFDRRFVSLAAFLSGTLAEQIRFLLSSCSTGGACKLAFLGGDHSESLWSCGQAVETCCYRQGIGTKVLRPEEPDESERNRERVNHGYR